MSVYYFMAILRIRCTYTTISHDTVKIHEFAQLCIVNNNGSYEQKILEFSLCRFYHYAS